jgi:hypothetical protein
MLLGKKLKNATSGVVKNGETGVRLNMAFWSENYPLLYTAAGTGVAPASPAFRSATSLLCAVCGGLKDKHERSADAYTLYCDAES